MTKLERHKKWCDNLHALYEIKNRAYGDSFGDTFNKLGIISAVTRITDKYNRLMNSYGENCTDTEKATLRSMREVESAANMYYYTED